MKVVNDLPLISIAMATYNGEKYLQEQLKSLLSQSYQNWKLVIHDDNSTDGTVNIIYEYVKKYPDKFTFIDDGISYGSASANFSFLLGQCDVDYIMFCDQDDVWFPDKVEKTLAKMKEMENKYPDTLILIHSDLKVADEVLCVIDDSYWHYEYINPELNSINRLIIQNTITGCTVMLNRKLARLSLPIPSESIMHDWWIGLVASKFGKIGFINEPTLFYRQHSGNDTGAKKFSYKTIVNKAVYLLFTVKHLRKNIVQANKFLERYRDEIDDQTIEMVENFCDITNKTYFQKRKILFKYKLLKQGLVRNIGLLLRI